MSKKILKSKLNIIKNMGVPVLRFINRSIDIDIIISLILNPYYNLQIKTKWELDYKFFIP